jgi:hypothetical protein
MAFERMKGVEGLVYVPDDGGVKKHPCRDCYFCQWCSDTRCDLCLEKKTCKKGRLQPSLIASKPITDR